ncbi:acyltransferase [Pseudoalteromonas sp. S16_S37]|uniref:acyltransferase n=1 Tax=Pseudoalteromonas sp. S16_S37 TaxID=2720228 RepID=UPI0016816BEB|nr:acyltransferase [Pseudoalteromonas sp. S16_S37]MBD1580968.1 acyltransferase [Pseudoalteromonas sp. S16_S37]
MKNSPHYSDSELSSLGFKQVGQRCLISRKASFYGIERIVLGDHVRIDDFCVLSAGAKGIEIGNFVHIAVFSSLIGAQKITLCNYANISSRVSIYSSSDDYSGEYMTNPMVPAEYTNVKHGPVYISEHCIIGSGAVVLPDVTIYQGGAVGALSLVTKDVNAFTVVAGTPAKKIKDRKKNLLSLQKQLEQQ